MFRHAALCLGKHTCPGMKLSIGCHACADSHVSEIGLNGRRTALAAVTSVTSGHTKKHRDVRTLVGTSKVADRSVRSMFGYVSFEGTCFLKRTGTTRRGTVIAGTRNLRTDLITHCRMYAGQSTYLDREVVSSYKWLWSPLYTKRINSAHDQSAELRFALFGTYTPSTLP